MKVDKAVFAASKAGNIPLAQPVAARVKGKDVVLVSTELGTVNIETGKVVNIKDISSYGEIDAMLSVVSTTKVESEAEIGTEVGVAWVVETKDGKHWFHCWESAYNWNLGNSRKAKLTLKTSGTLPTIYKMKSSASNTSKQIVGSKVVAVTVNLGG